LPSCILLSVTSPSVINGSYSTLANVAEDLWLLHTFSVQRRLMCLLLCSVDVSVPWPRRLGRGSPNSGSPRKNSCPQAPKYELDQGPWQNSSSWTSQSNFPCRMTCITDNGCRNYTGLGTRRQSVRCLGFVQPRRAALQPMRPLPSYG
jgi:hypothetical protein